MTDPTEQALSETPSEFAPHPLDYRRIEVIDPEVAAIMRRKTVAQESSLVIDANRTMRVLIAWGLRSDSPNWSQLQIGKENAERRFSTSLMC